MGTPIGQLQGTDYAADKEYAKSKSASSPKEIINKKGQIVVMYNQGDARFATAFDPKTGAEIKHTVFSTDGSHYTNEKTTTGSIMSFGNKNHLERRDLCDTKGKITQTTYYNAQGKADSIDYKN